MKIELELKSYLGTSNKGNPVAILELIGIAGTRKLYGREALGFLKRTKVFGIKPFRKEFKELFKITSEMYHKKNLEQKMK